MDIWKTLKKVQDFKLTSPYFLDPLAATCPNEWLENGNYCYHKYDLYDGKSWLSARQTCQFFGADLVSILDADEQRFIVKNLTPKKIYWIGLSDQLLEGSWIWSDKSSSNYRNWRKYASEPNNLHGKEDCAELSSYFGGQWNDANCDNKFGFLCKKGERHAITVLLTYIF